MPCLSSSRIPAESPSAPSSLHFEWLEEMPASCSGARAMHPARRANVLPPGHHAVLRDNGSGIQMMFQLLLISTCSIGSLPRTPGARRPLRANREDSPYIAWAQFLPITTSSISPAEREAAAVSFQRFGPDRAMQLYDRGLRRRCADARRSTQHGAGLQHAVRAARYAGDPLRDEIGMGENLALPERESVRTPCMERRAQTAASRSPTPADPVISEGVYGCEQVNVENATARSAVVPQLAGADDSPAQGDA